MKTIVVDIETIADRDAMRRCGYEEAEDRFAPWPLHRLACVSLLTVTGRRDANLDFSLESHSLRTLSERGVVASVERDLSSADRILTYNGRAFDFPVLHARAISHDEYAPTLARLVHHCRPGLHRDLHAEVKGADGGISLSHLCAAFAIPAKCGGTGSRVAELAAEERWLDIEHYCESDVVATWLAAQMWESAESPGFGRARWNELANWLNAGHFTNPCLSLFAAGPPLAGAGREGARGV